ncbi:glycosyltransferase [Halarcobacter anaerophilus]|uniref:Glycosyl transferase n=1 Tax=Halarcobacter anaerophilus TaxID=877500 RepID=A0A4Q0Y3M0_9BACT|nr:glycosyltransferase [Halarcobacter anaerophilus]QDF29540.1 glycosyltransferase, family 1 [Halarcobacter anaerophilus]RXJ64776.1 glycosyl transferase [Halarcobacter anaerophilus]
MKIVYISRSIIPSRTANSINVMKMCSSFASLGHEVILLAPWTKKLEEKEIDDIFEYYGVEENFILKKIYSPNIKYLKKKIYSYLCLKKVQKINPDFVYGRDDMFAFYLTQKNGYFTLFERHEPFRKNDFEHKMFKKFLGIKKNKIKFVTISKKLREIYSKSYNLKEDEISVAQSATGLFNNQDLPDIEFSKDKINIGYIGSLFKGRGIETIIELAKHFANIDFHIIGGKKEDIIYWKEKSKKLDNLFFYGFINPKETYKYRNMCDILLAPYQGEKAGNRNSDYMSPIKIFEYMASKKSIICSDLPAIRESINENHAIFVKNDDVNEWIKALSSLIDNQNNMKKLSENAYDYCLKNFTYEARSKKILELVK